VPSNQGRKLNAIQKQEDHVKKKRRVLWKNKWTIISLIVKSAELESDLDATDAH